MLCILYVIFLSTCLGLFALLVEQILPATAPRRWVWCAVIAVSVIVPPFSRGHHSWSLIQGLEHHAMQEPSSRSSVAPVSVLDPDWWTAVDSHDLLIQRVWLTASALLILWGLANAWRVSSLVRVARRKQRNAGAPAVIDGVPVVVTDAVGPATVGLMRSRVLIPRWVLALPGVQRRYVLCHEDQHRSAHDTHLLFIMSLTLILLPWNVALWWQLRRLRLAVEMDCDNRVVAKLGNPTAYGALLLRVAEASNRGPRLQPALLGVGMLERRLNLLLAPTPLADIQRFMVPCLALGLLFLGLWMPHPVLGHSAHSHVAMTSTAGSSTSPNLSPPQVSNVILQQR